MIFPANQLTGRRKQNQTTTKFDTNNLNDVSK